MLWAFQKRLYILNYGVLRNDPSILNLVYYIQHSSSDWSIDYLMCTFGVFLGGGWGEWGVSSRALQM